MRANKKQTTSEYTTLRTVRVQGGSLSNGEYFFALFGNCKALSEALKFITHRAKDFKVVIEHRFVTAFCQSFQRNCSA